AFEKCGGALPEILRRTGLPEKGRLEAEPFAKGKIAGTERFERQPHGDGRLRNDGPHERFRLLDQFAGGEDAVDQADLVRTLRTDTVAGQDQLRRKAAPDDP